MTVAHLGAHRVGDGDSIDGIVARYGLSSRAALSAIPANEPLRPVFDGLRCLEAGMLLFIPPPAIGLARDRAYLLNRVRPLFLSHFDELREAAGSKLAAAMGRWRSSGRDAELREMFADLEASVDEAVVAIAGQLNPIVGNCRGMALTHVAEPADHAVVNAAADPLCGLFWTIRPPILEQWRIFWQPDDCLSRWAACAADEAHGTASRQWNTIGSLVVQQVDQRIRDAQSLEARLRAERSGQQA